MRRDDRHPKRGSSSAPVPAAPPATARDIRRALRRLANPRDAKVLRWFFKTGPGEYGEGDRFLGVRVPALRALAREFPAAGADAAGELLASPFHEERLLGLLLLVRCFERGTPAERLAIFRLYLKNTASINNWDLVDLSAPNIVGAHLAERDRSLLDRLARSPSLWERRIAIVATHAFIRRGQFEDIFRIADRLLGDREDLIHKAIGWMLREAGKRDAAALESWLRPRCRRLPRTMLRYAIERFPPAKRQAYLRGNP